MYHHTPSWWRNQMETFSALLAIFVRGIHRSPVNSPHKGKWRGALKLPLIYVWINGWVNNREAGDLRRYRAHYGVIIMIIIHSNTRVNPLRAKFLIGNKKMYLWFLSFLYTDTTRAVEIPVCVSQYHGCWCPGDARSQGIICHNNDFVEPE